MGTRKETKVSPYGSNLKLTPEQVRAGIPKEWLDPSLTHSVESVAKGLPYHTRDSVPTNHEHEKGKVRQPRNR